MAGSVLVTGIIRRVSLKTICAFDQFDDKYEFLKRRVFQMDEEERISTAEGLAARGDFAGARKMAAEVLGTAGDEIVKRRAADLLERTGIDRVFIYVWAFAALFALGIIIKFVI